MMSVPVDDVSSKNLHLSPHGGVPGGIPGFEEITEDVLARLSLALVVREGTARGAYPRYHKRQAAIRALAD